MVLMNFLKNTLLSVIAIQLLVLAQLSFAKYNQTKSEQEILVLQKSSIVNKSNKFINSSISLQLEKEIRTLLAHPLSNEYLSILHDWRKHNKSCSSIEENAKKLLGLKYVWGATGPKNFDCSGFTQQVYKTAGINIPRVSREQAKVGKLISYEELKKGDMVFFDTNRKQTGKVNHVGIYLEDNQFIHASSGNKRVVITNFEKKIFYKKRFLWGRRLIQKNSKMELHTRQQGLFPNIIKI